MVRRTSSRTDQAVAVFRVPEQQYQNALVIR